MLIASLIVLISNPTNTFAATPKLSTETLISCQLQNTISRLKSQLEVLQKTNNEPTKSKQRKSAKRSIRKQLRCAKDERLIERCNRIPGISSLIASFLLPCSIPALREKEGELFVRQGCDTCASYSHDPYLSITSQGNIYRHGHYDVRISGSIKCPNREQIEVSHPLSCNYLTNMQPFSRIYSGPLSCRNTRHTFHLHKTYVYSNHSIHETMLNGHVYKKPSDISWYQQCYTFHANQSVDKKPLCKHHFIIALAKSHDEENKLFVWSAFNGKLEGTFQVSPHMELLSYKNPHNNVILSTSGVDGFLWWRNTQNGCFMRLDKRGIWEVVLKNNPQPVWHCISPNAQWLLQRLETEGTRTTFSRTSLAHAILQEPTEPKERMSFHKQTTLWNVTTALWLNTAFEHLNYSKSAIAMEPRWIVRYHNLKGWLAQQDTTLAKGLQERIHAGTQSWIAIRDKAIKSHTQKSKKRKHR